MGRPPRPGGRRPRAEADGQKSASTHVLARGDRARQVARPWRISRRLNLPRSARRDHGVQHVLDLHRVGLGGQAEPARQPLARGCRPAGPGRSKRDAAHHVGRLATDPRQGDQVGHPGRHLAAEPGRPRPRPCRGGCASWPGRSRSDGSAPRPRRPVSAASDAGVGVPGEQRRGGPVDPFVGALGRQDGGGQQLEGVGVVEGAQLGGRPGVQRARAGRWPHGPGRPACGVGPWAEDTGRFCAHGRARGRTVVARSDRRARRPRSHDLLDRVAATTGRPRGLSEARRRALDRAAVGAGPARLAVAGHGTPPTGGWSATPRWTTRGPGRPQRSSSSPCRRHDGDRLGDRLARRGPRRVRRRRRRRTCACGSTHAGPADDVRAAARGFVRERDLVQLRCRLPLPPPPGAGPTGGRHPGLPGGRRRAGLARRQQPRLRRPPRAGAVGPGHAPGPRGRAVVRPGRASASSRSTAGSPGRAGPRCTRADPAADGRDLRDRRSTPTSTGAGSAGR